MFLTNSLRKEFSSDHLKAGDAQRLAHLIAMGPMVFQLARILVKRDVLSAIEHDGGLSLQEVQDKAGLSRYATKCLLEGALTLGILSVDDDERFHVTKLGWFLQNDKMVRVNIDFNHDVNYAGMAHLDEALAQGRPAGLCELGNWPTIYEGLSQLNPQAQDSWFAFDHYYSDVAFDQALQIIFSQPVRRLVDVGGNTGRFALRCVDFDPHVQVTIVDLPQQIQLMRNATAGQPGSDRISGFPTNLLDPDNALPTGADVIWMSQFLDCFSEEQILSIVSRAAAVMSPDSRLFVMETFWDRQQYPTAAADLTMTSLYFTAMANGNSKMYHSDDMISIFNHAGLQVVDISDHLGTGHSLVELKLK